ncbi:MAG: EI24 domain-containing protein [Flavobacteriales bacterium]|nr:EI24 domain-containing protein [Flavobacteriales bacterium]
MHQVLAGVEGFMKAGRFMLKHRMAWMFLVPVLLWIAFALGVYELTRSLVDALGERVAAWFSLELPAQEREGLQGFWDSLLRWLSGSGELLVLIVLKVALFFLFALVNKYAVLVLLSPLLAYASERAEQVLSGVERPFQLGQMLWETGRGAAIALRNGAVEVSINLVLWVATLFLPILAPFTAALLFLVSAYFYGFSMFDYIFERRRTPIGQSFAEMNKRLGMVVANGALFSLLMKVPVLGITTAPLLAAVGAVLAIYKEEPSLIRDVRSIQ